MIMGEGHSIADDASGISREHQVQIRLMQALAGAVARGESIDETLSHLSDYSRAHFLSEELLMRLYDYPDYDTHVHDHERMVEWIDALEARKGDAAAMTHAVQELSAIFMRHIASCDSNLHGFMSRLPA
jgi:hemerythrin